MSENTWVYTDTNQFIRDLERIDEEIELLQQKRERLIQSYKSDILSSMHNKFYK